MNSLVSIFQNVWDSQPATIPILECLEDIRNGKYAKQVNQYRQSGDTQVKKTLPAVTFGSICKGGRKLQDVVCCTGWVALDIDYKDNPGIKDWGKARNEIAKIVNVGFTFISTGGRGLCCGIKVTDPARQSEHFEELKKDFGHLDIKLDPSKGRNPNDLRFFSYDPEAVIKEEFVPYSKLPMGNRRKNNHKPSSITRAEVEAILKKLELNPVDITEGYHNWLKIGFALAEEFGESGRSYFHAVSCYHLDYDPRQTDDQYTRCLESNREGVTIRSFFHLCNQYGVYADPLLNKTLETNGKLWSNGNNASYTKFNLNKYSTKPQVKP